MFKGLNCNVCICFKEGDKILVWVLVGFYEVCGDY